MRNQSNRADGRDAADVVVDEVIAVPARALYDLVSDVTRMGEWSPETTSCRWVRGATGPKTGARFRGSNRNGWRRWSTSCTVVAAEPGSRFSFEVDLPGIPISRWTYEFFPEGQNTRVRESWVDRRPGWMDRFGKLVRGVADTPAHNRAGMEATLAALRHHAEATSASA